MAKSYATPTTGVYSNGGLVQLGQNNTADQWDYVTIPMPTQPLRILVEGNLPTNSTTPTMSVSFFEGTIPLFSASGTWQVQGQSSTTASKKNWKFKLVNSATGNKLSVKVGGWPAMTSITCKAYATDRTLMRDSLTTELWRNMHKYPSGYLAPLSAYQYFDNTDFGVHQSALFSTAGVPVEIWQNGAFLGLYVMRADNDLPAYLMDDSNTQHILIQPQHSDSIWVTENSGGGGNQTAGIFKVIREQMRPELRARWAQLRDAGVISNEAIANFINAYGAMMNPDMMAQDIANWPTTGWTGTQLGAIKIAQSVSYLVDIANQRMAWIDGQFGYSGA